MKLFYSKDFNKRAMLLPIICLRRKAREIIALKEFY